MSEQSQKWYTMDIDLNKAVSANIFVFKLTGLWPFGNKKLYNLYKGLVITGVLLYNIAGSMYLLKNLDNAEEVSQTMYNLITTVSVMVKLWMFLNNFELFKSTVEPLRAPEFQPRTEEQRKMLKSGIFWSYFVFYYFFIIGDLTIIMWIFSPLLDKERRLPSKAWFPYDYFSPQYYAATYTFQGIIICCYIGFPDIALDTLFAILMIQISAQCDVLSDELSKLGSENSDDPEVLHGDLCRCIHHHQLIVDLSQKIQSAFGNVVFVQFVTSVSVLCETMFLLSLSEFNATFVALLVYQTAIFSQVFLYCYFGNEVFLKSEQLYYSAYTSNWYNCPQSFKKDLVFFMHRAQKPIILIVENLFPITLTTFTSILRSAWAYFMALRNVHSD